MNHGCRKDLRREDHVIWFSERPEPYVIRRRTFDINYVTIMGQRREDDYLIVTLCVKGDHHDDKIDITDQEKVKAIMAEN